MESWFKTVCTLADACRTLFVHCYRTDTSQPEKKYCIVEVIARQATYSPIRENFNNTGVIT